MIEQFCSYFFTALRAFLKQKKARTVSVALFISVTIFVCSALTNTAFAATTPSGYVGATWKAEVGGNDILPPLWVAVDKEKQLLYLMEGKEPLKIAGSYLCTTGQAVGDKLIEDDLKTPEGVYFVVRHITSGLDYIKYGNEAYTLNYPNPVDRIRQKTGYGIWIHGRGEPLRPLQTQGCISMINEELEVLGKLLPANTPIVLTEGFSSTPTYSETKQKNVQILKQQVEQWAEAWSNRSASMFSFYNQKAYTSAQGEAFSAFQAQKERLFKSLPWIKTTVHGIQALPGPDYWVTWFYQEYSAPNLSTRGIRRLYWEPDASGNFKIIAMEWFPGERSQNELSATATSILATIRSGEATRKVNIITYQAANNILTIAETPPAIVGTPSSIPNNTFVSAGNKTATGNTPNSTILAENTINLDHIEDPSLGTPAMPHSVRGKVRDLKYAIAPEDNRTQVAVQSPVDKATDPAPVTSVLAKTDIASKTGLPPALPAQRLDGTTETMAADSTKTPVPDKSSTIAQTSVDSKNITALPTNEVDTPANTPVTANAPLSSTGADLTPSTAKIDEFIETWRMAWESADIKTYINCYTADSVQPPRKGKTAIHKQKEQLWKRRPPIQVHLENIKMTLEEENVILTMRQVYKDAQGGGDIGNKTLTLKYSNGAWRIAREEWDPLL